MNRSTQPKPWYRPRNVLLTLLGAVLLFFGWAFLEVWQVYTAEPNPTVDYRAKLRKMAEQNAGVSPEEADDSWRLLVDALEAYKEAERQINEELAESGFSSRGTFDDGQVDFNYPLFGSTLPDDVNRERQCLQRMRELGVTQLLDRLSTTKIALRPVEGSGPLIDDLLPYASPARQLAKNQAMSIRISAAEGHSNQLVEAFKHALNLAETISHQPTLIEYLIAVSMAALALNELQSSLVESDFRPDTYSALSATLTEFSPSRVVFSLECERVHYHDLAGWVFTDDGHGDGFMTSKLDDWGLISSGQESIAKAIIARIFLATKRETLAELDDLIDWLAVESNAAATRVSLADRFTQRLVDLHMTGRFPFVGAVLGALDRAIHNEDALQVEISGTLVMIAIAEYKVRKGEYPVRLDDLVPPILAAVPIDPLHGGPFGYRLTPDDPHGRPYLLYSTGLDRNDDGGDFDLADSMRCIGDPNAQTDYTVNQPRRPMADYWDEFR